MPPAKYQAPLFCQAPPLAKMSNYYIFTSYNFSVFYSLPFLCMRFTETPQSQKCPHFLAAFSLPQTLPP